MKTIPTKLPAARQTQVASTQQTLNNLIAKWANDVGPISLCASSASINAIKNRRRESICSA
jgi:hypothetical protein